MKMTLHTPPNSMSAIFQQLLNRFQQNFKRRFLGPSQTDSKYQSNVCTGNICSCDICPYKEYLNLYWAVFDQTLKVSSWDHLRHIWQLSWWHLSKQHLSWRHLYISQIPHLLLNHIFENLHFFGNDLFFVNKSIADLLTL